MRPLLKNRELDIPEGVTVDVQSRRITVKGPRGTLKKDLSHICADMYIVDGEEGQKKLKVDCHFRKQKELSSLRTVVSHVSNMIVGVTHGYKCVPHARVLRNVQGARRAVKASRPCAAICCFISKFLAAQAQCSA